MSATIKCPDCGGTGKYDSWENGIEDCDNCDGTGMADAITISQSEYDYLLDSLSEQHHFLRDLLKAGHLDEDERVRAFELSAQSKPNTEDCLVCNGRSIIHETESGGATICPCCYLPSSPDDEPPF